MVKYTLYKDAACTDAVSQGGAFSNPIFEYPPNTFDGVAGEAKTVHLYGRNDGDMKLKNCIIQPIDTVGTDESDWTVLATSEVDLATNTPGSSLSLPDLNPSETHSNVWLRTSVPTDTEPQLKRDISVRFTATAVVV